MWVTQPFHRMKVKYQTIRTKFRLALSDLRTKSKTIGVRMVLVLLREAIPITIYIHQRLKKKTNGVILDLSPFANQFKTTKQPDRRKKMVNVLLLRKRIKMSYNRHLS